MDDFKLEGLPILVVSAKDHYSASNIIKEIIDNINAPNSEDNNIACAWKLVNKYYTADVRLLAVLDGQELDAKFEDSIEGHLIYMSEDESTGKDAVNVMRRRAQSVSGAHVRVVAADCAEAALPLVTASAADRLELVPLREAPGDDDERDECGLARVRAAFHAHIWPGLMRRGCDDSLESNHGAASDSSEEEWSEWCSGPRSADSEQEQAFAAALAALPDAAAAARHAAQASSREERLARAEDLVAAFCRALGTPMD